MCVASGSPRCPREEYLVHLVGYSRHRMTCHRSREFLFACSVLRCAAQVASRRAAFPRSDGKLCSTSAAEDSPLWRRRIFGSRNRPDELVYACLHTVPSCRFYLVSPEPRESIERSVEKTKVQMKTKRGATESTCPVPLGAAWFRCEVHDEVAQ